MQKHQMLAAKKITEKLKFISKIFKKDTTEGGGYWTCNFRDKENNLIIFHNENKVFKSSLKKNSVYVIEYTKIPTRDRVFRGFRPLSIKNH